jgi:hypothetical protein
MLKKEDFSMLINEELSHHKVEKLKAKELLGSQKMSELRTKIRELEGEVRVREASYLEHMTKIRKTEQQLVRAEVAIFI